MIPNAHPKLKTMRTIVCLSALVLIACGGNKSDESNQETSIETRAEEPVSSQGFSFFSEISEKLPIYFPNDSIEDPTSQFVDETLLRAEESNGNYLCITKSEDPTSGDTIYFLKVFGNSGRSLISTQLYGEDSGDEYEFIENSVLKITNAGSSTNMYYAVSKGGELIKSINAEPKRGFIQEITDAEFASAESIKPEYSFGNLFPQDQNLTREEVLAAELLLLNNTELAQRDQDDLIIGDIRHTNAPQNEYWFQGITSMDFMVVLNRSVVDGIEKKDISVYSPDGAQPTHLPNTHQLYQLEDGRLIQLFSLPTPGRPNGKIKVWQVQDSRALTEIREIHLPDTRPTDVRLLDETTILVRVAPDDTGESPAQYIRVSI